MELIFFPFKIWRACGFIPLILLGLFIGSICGLSQWLTPILYTELASRYQTGHIPEWAFPNLLKIAVLLPWIVSFPVLYGLAAYCTRICFIKSHDITLGDNFKFLWLSLGFALRCYASIWTTLPWYLLPMFAAIFTSHILPNLVPAEYEIFAEWGLVALTFICILTALPTLFAPLAASLGLYEPYYASYYSRQVYNLKSFPIIIISALFSTIMYFFSQSFSLSIENPSITPSIAFVLIYLFLMYVSIIYVKTLSAVEVPGMR